MTLLAVFIMNHFEVHCGLKFAWLVTEFGNKRWIVLSLFLLFLINKRLSTVCSCFYATFFDFTRMTYFPFLMLCFFDCARIVVCVTLKI